jgi:hypothetical protein
MLDRRALCVAFPKRHFVHRLRLVILFSTLLGWAASVHAATVAIVRPPNPSPELNETLFRLHGEVLSVGLDVEIVVRPAARALGRTDARAWLEEMASEHGVDAVIEVVNDGAPLAADVWVVETSPRRLDVSRVTVEASAGNTSKSLSIRAIEVLRSSLLAIDLAGRERRPKSSAPLPQGEMNRPGHLGLEVGAAALTSLGGVGPAVLPVLRVGWAVRSWLMVQGTLAGLGSRPTVASTTGHARVAQQYGILGGCHPFGADHRVRPFVALSAGVLHTSLEGQADAPELGHSVDQWSVLLDGSLGAELPLYGRTYLTLAAHGQVAAPYLAIHFADEVVATSGRPNLLMTLTFGVRL